MAAAGLPRSRGVAGARATKGLFFILTLMCVVGLASSWTDKDALKEVKGKVKKLERELNFKKATMDLSSELMTYYADFMDPLSDLLKKATKTLPGDFPPVERLMESLKGFVKKTKTFVDTETEELGEEIEEAEEELAEVKKLIRMLEEQQAEL